MGELLVFNLRRSAGALDEYTVMAEGPEFHFHDMSYACKRQRRSTGNAPSTTHARNVQSGCRKLMRTPRPRSVYPAARLSRPQNALPDPLVPPSDAIPTTINNTWKAVRMSKQPPHYTQPTAASRRKQPTRTPPSPSTTSVPSSSVTKASSVLSAETVRNSRYKATNSNFRSTVLSRYGIIIGSDVDLRSPFEHFGTVEPEWSSSADGYAEGVVNWYQKDHQKPDSNIWLRMNGLEAKRVAEQYRALDSMTENEAKFSHRGKNYFFKEDDITPFEDTARPNTAYFKLEWGPNPDEHNLRRPPLVTGSEDTSPRFTFTTNPDCTYWLRLCRINSNYRAEVRKLTFTLPKEQAVAPYLTVEFKKYEQKEWVAENQLAIAGALILFNRLRLRCDRLRKCSQASSSWEMKTFKDLKHYGITFSGANASLFCITPTLDLEAERSDGHMEKDSLDIWRGCSVNQIRSFVVSREADVLELQRWINEIHNWGLGVHSDNCILDIQAILMQQRGGDRISMSLKDMKKCGINPGVSR